MFPPTDAPWFFEAARKASSPAKKIFLFGIRMPWQPWRDGTWRQSTLVWGLKEGTLKLGGLGEPFNPDILSLLNKVRVMSPDFGEVTVPDLVLKRADQMKFAAFEPFTGPIKDQGGKVRIQSGERLSSMNLDWSKPWPMDWLVDNVKGTVPNQ